MADISISIRNRVAYLTKDTVIVNGNSDYRVRFDFDSEWDAYPEKTLLLAYYTRGGRRTYQEAAFSGKTATVPVLRNTHKVLIGVSAGDIRTSTPAEIKCALCVTDGKSKTAVGIADVYNQIMEAIAPQKPAVVGYVLTDADGYGVRDRLGVVITVKG